MRRAPLWRNRDFLLLLVGQLLSTLGSQATSIVYPLLVLGLTHSPAKAGVVGFARVAPYALLGPLAGALADRWNRKALMVGADAVRLVAVASLVSTIASGSLVYWQIPVVAFVEGAASALFAASEAGARRAIVPAPQMPAATAAITGRQSVVLVAGPPLGGALYAVGRVVPFALDAASYACSTVALLAMRTPFQERRVRAKTRLRAEIAEGFRYLWRQPFLRTCALLFGIGNFVFPGIFLVIVVLAKRHGLSSGEIGLLTAVFGVGLLAGTALSAFSRRLLSVRTILLLELWTWTGSALFLVWPNVYVLTASFLPTMLAVPSTDSVVHAFRIAMTPDRLVGRVDSAARTIGLFAAPLGPLLAGFLLDSVSARETVAVFTGCGLVLALWGALSPSIKQAPTLADLDAFEAGDMLASAPID